MPEDPTPDRAKRGFVIGWPILHSRSPLIHGYWLKKYGISGGYDKISVKPENLADFIRSIGQQGFAGGNITLPHKQAIVELLDRLEPAAKVIGAVNTVWFEGGKLVGDNTDWIGFAENLDEFAPGWADEIDPDSHALVIGAGGASRAIIHALAQRGYRKILIANRTLERAETVAEAIGNGIEAVSLDQMASKVDKCALVVNTTSVGMEGKDADAGGLPPAFCDLLDALPQTTLVTDIVYVPLETPFLAAAQVRGLRTVDGLGMLLHQAVPGFERWFGVKPEVTPQLRQLILDDLEGSSR